MTDRQYHKHLSAIDVWKIRMPIRTTNMHSLKRFKELQKLKFEWQAAGHVSSEYEQNVGKLLAKKKERLEELMKNPEQNRGEIAMLSTEVETLQSLFENYNLGMNVFRRAQGGRSSLRE